MPRDGEEALFTDGAASVSEMLSLKAMSMAPQPCVHHCCRFSHCPPDGTGCVIQSTKES